MGEDRRTPDRTDELIAELRDRVRSLENQLRQERAANRENRHIIASLTSRTPELASLAAPEAGLREPIRRRIRSWWKEKYGAAMVGVLTAFAVLAASGEEIPLPGGGEEQQAGVPTTTQPAPPGPVGTEPVPVAPAPEPAPSQEPAPTEPVR